MRIILRLIKESFIFAFTALHANLLRTTLSLLGVSVGIFAIIAVFTLVDSLETKLKSSFDFLGSNNVNVEKWPYGLGGPYPWWKYLSRPHPTYDEFKLMEANLKNAQAITMIVVKGGAIVKHENNSSTGIDLTGATHGYSSVVDVPINSGRYFTVQEAEDGNNVAIIGHRVAKELFPFAADPLGKDIKIKGLKYKVIGVMAEEGEGFLGLPSNDDKVLVPYHSMKKLYYSGRTNGLGATISVKGKPEDVGLFQLESEIRGLVRSKRGLKPTQEDDFAINRPEAIANFIGATFDVISVAGWIIGSFSILVGGFGIANIMFVSVKERTPIIGIQKSLGAKNYFILFQFLFEAVFLSVFGGLLGLGFVYLVTFVELGSLKLALSVGNVMLGIGVSAIIGVVSGIVPAMMAARMDPVEAIRS